MSYLIDRQAAIMGLIFSDCTGDLTCGQMAKILYVIQALPSAQPEIIRCKDCEYGEQDEVGRWFCRSLGCQIGNEDGSGYCADAERRTDGF